ncbi:CHAP domain-containing protein [Siccirubricoccus sp. KC 17139]|uniref:CHAP domain-containing protein n=1 Tax=Siccirubricoccus soli TaxID=2899147 RepID=A0ABT1D7X8_9PROT|nr:CHAP domain-containing protein [Siccirubricoccus soli]MCO6418044.1 CHAP domain-containing protein [Siccirubricoccus soli]MCP2684179.1 CHAP domain-containing protein [Siccirubricoccus soli]
MPERQGRDESWVRRGVLAAPLLLAACGTGRRVPAPTGAVGEWSCVPYARHRSGIPLRGDAWQWWEAAAGQYRREHRPLPGSVLVLMRTRRLPQGHLSVVSRVISAREIRVDHANWASGAAKGRVAVDQPVLDVSPENDWSLVRVWYPRVNDFGASRYPAYGFIAAT